MIHYNNELTGCVAIYSVLRSCKKISVAKAMLIAPICFQDNLIKYITRYTMLSINDLITRKPEYFFNFNDRFISFFSLSINAIMILKEMGLVEIDRENRLSLISGVKENLFTQELGMRMKNIISAGEKVSLLLDESEANLYIQLRVRL
ncbi:hypothetical protein HCC18_01745 [Listeria booriae]|uniref:three component ABC system middle component n=1 Tax=Listeria booriae TaxID=1552123 RepID=UPI0016294992|nr:three component ABC system middle component [Listeria booriae]MBC1357315.1 hypothetical protein [Listeria booriae]MBC2257803.1 hypothetical protein [Listeria booriae]MBC2315552.1 hypothetical protein [Listeria booriae]